MRKMIRKCAAALAILCLCALLGATALADGAAPEITKDLTRAVTIKAGDDMTLTIEASGDGLSYQWYMNDDPIEGAESASYTESDVPAERSGARYFCYVQNEQGGVSSTSCTVTVVTRPALTQDLGTAELVIDTGDTITLTASATSGNSTGMLTQWYILRGGAAVPITGETSGTIQYTVGVEDDGAEIYCQFTNEAGSTSTTHCVLSINNPEPTPSPTPTPAPEPPKVTKDPTAEPPVEEGGSAIYIARADNTTSYKWRFVSASGSQSYDYNNLGGMFTGLVVSGGDTEILTLSNIPYTLDGWQVECVFTGPGGTATSRRATVTVIESAASLSVISQPADATMAIDENENFRLFIQAVSRNGGALSYQWYSAARNSMASMRIIEGATDSAYVPPREEGTRYYYVSVTVTANGVTSAPFNSAVARVTFTPSKAHEHVYSTVWEYNDISHWHQCTCGDHADEGFHSFQWTILRKPTATEDGEQHGVCSVCGYETDQPIPAGSMPEATAAADESAQNNTGANAGRFLLGMALGLGAAAVIGGAGYMIWRVVRGKEGGPADK